MTKDVPPAEYLNVYPPKKCMLLQRLGPVALEVMHFLLLLTCLKRDRCPSQHVDRCVKACTINTQAH